MKKLFVWFTVTTLYLLAAVSCSSPEQKLAGYWDGYDFHSLDGFSDYNAAEKKFDNYIKLLNKVPHDAAVADLKKFMESAKLNEVAYMTWEDGSLLYCMILNLVRRMTYFSMPGLT